MLDIIDAISAGGTVAAVIVGWIVYRGQNRLARELHSSQERLVQRQLIVPLWEYLSKVPDINPDQPVEPDVIQAINTLELIALCCEGRMIDDQIIYRTFSDGYVRLYERIQQVKSLRSRAGISGNDLLKENLAAMSCYDQLMARRKNRDRIQN